MRNLDNNNHVIANLLKVSAIISFGIFLAACGDDSSKTSGGSVEDQEVIAITDKTVSGVSQKGPFVNGSSVTVQELDGETLAQTGKSFKGKISNDKGEFSVSSVTLASQYAILEAMGYYRNEVSGKKSNGTITLNALTDLSNRKKANINLLTHLEYDRVLYLVTHEKMSVEEAKKQAESEILNAFNIKGDFASSEDLDIFSKGDGNAALLAFSILMLNDCNEADFTELLANFATDIEKDGKWNDDENKTKIADWAANEDLSDGFASIRKNIEKWELGVVPDFEKFIRSFWQKNYELDDCNKDREGEVNATKNKLSSKYDSQERYICKNAKWVVASDIEKDTYKWKTGKDGESKWGDVNTENCYVFEENAWRSGNASDCSLKLQGCTKSKQDSVGFGADSVWYICSEKSWVKATVVGDGNFLICSNDGKIVLSKNVKYVCDGGNFRELDSLEIIADSACTSYNRSVYYVLPKVYHYLGNEKERWSYNPTFRQEMNDSVVVENNYSYYKCTDSGWALTSEKRNEGVVVDKRDGHKYKTIGINSQIWMAENLNYSLKDTSQSVCYNKNEGYMSRIDASTPIEGNGVTEDFNAGFEKNGYYNFENNATSQGTWKLYSQNATEAILTIRYANGENANRDMMLMINDFEIGKVEMPTTGSWSTWQTVSAKVQLVLGINTVVLKSITAIGGANVDMFYFDVEGVYNNADVENGLPLEETSQTICYNNKDDLCYNNEEKNCSKYGKLYTKAVLENICPEGFRLPSRVDWIKLFEFTYVFNGDSVFSGKKGKCGGDYSSSLVCNGDMIKSKDYWPSDSNGTDVFGFNALPAGIYNEKEKTSVYGGYKKGFSELNHYAEFWAGSDPEMYQSDKDFYRVYLTIKNEVGVVEDVEEGSARSVRCVKD